MHKRDLIIHLREHLLEKVAAIQADIASTLAARNTDTKSSAGDKHEVGRAMIQQELDQQEAQLAKLQLLQQELDRVPLDRVYARVGFGSLVTTDQGDYFIAIGLGQVEVDGQSCFVISLASPIGQALKDKQIGDAVAFNSRIIRVMSIA
ncbi:MAG: GreA/GreB family elongation factor [Flavobacteriales bacterium]|nr:GreA/GreB family elongation factor [Flavobacteriales bacterium]